jgi:hypothetical protein
MARWYGRTAGSAPGLLAGQRNEIERSEQFVTKCEVREYVYHL